MTVIPLAPPSILNSALYSVVVSSPMVSIFLEDVQSCPAGAGHKMLLARQGGKSGPSMLDSMSNLTYR